jgi:hypothetical protein
MATNTWSKATAGNWSEDASWSLGHKPATGEDIVFDATGVGTCAVDEAPANLNTLTIAGAFTGSFNAGGQNFTIASTISITPSATTTFTASGIWTQTGDADFTLANSGAYSIDSLKVVLQGTGTFSIAKNNVYFAKLTCAASGKTTSIGSMGGTFGNTGIKSASDNMLTCGGGTLTISVTNMYLNLWVTGTCTPYALNGTTISGVSGTRFWCRAAIGGITISLPVYSSTTIYTHIVTDTGVNGDVVFNMTGNFSIVGPGLVSIIHQNSTTSGTMTFNTNNYTLSCNTTIYAGSACGRMATYNWGSSTINCSSLDAYTTPLSTQNFQTSTWSVASNWLMHSSTTINVGTFSLTSTNIFAINSSGTRTSTPFYNLYITNNTCTLSDNITANTITINSGSFNQNSKTITTTSSFTWNAAGTLTLNANITMTGDGDFTVNNTGTGGATSGTYTFQGTTQLKWYKSMIFGGLVCAYPGKAITIVNGGVNHYFNGLTLNGGTFTNNGALSLDIWGSLTLPLTFNGSVIVGTGTFRMDQRNDGSTLTLPALSNITQTTVFINFQANSSGACFITQTGDINVTANLEITNQQGHVSNASIYTSNGFAITCTGALKIGALGNFATTFNMGSSTISCGSFDGTTYTSGTVSWTHTGNLTAATGFTYTQAGTITASGTYTVTGNGNFTFANSGTYSVASMSVILQGTGTFSLLKPNVLVYDVSIAYTNKTTTISGINASTGCSHVLTLNGGTMELGASYFMIKGLLTTGYLVINPGSVIHGTGPATILRIESTVTTNNATLNVPAISASCQVYITNITTGNTYNVSIDGAINVLALTLRASIFNTNNNTITASSTTGISLWSATVYFGSSFVSVGNISDTSGSTWNLQTSQWTISGNITFIAGSVVFPGASQFSITAGCNLTSAGKSLFNISISASTLLLDALSCNTIAVTAGNFNQNSKILTLASSFTWNSAGTLTLNAATTMTGDGDFIINNIGTITGNGGAIVLQGTGQFSFARGSVGYAGLTCAAAGKTTTVVNTTTASNPFALTLGGGTFTLSSDLLISCSTSDALTIGSTTINGSGQLTIQTITASLNIPSLIMGGTTSLKVQGAMTGTATINQVGAISVSSMIVTTTSTTCLLIYNVGSNLLTVAGVLQTGRVASGDANSSFNFGSSTVSIGSFDQFTLPNSTINLQSATVNCAGSWQYGTNTTVIGGSTAVLTFTYTATLTTAGKAFPSVVMNCPGYTFTLGDNLSCVNATFTAGAFNLNSKTITCSGRLTTNIPLTLTVASYTFDSLSMQAGCALQGSRTLSRLIVGNNATIIFTATTTTTVTTYTAGDWDGSTFKSSILGTQYTIVCPTEVEFINANITDCNASRGTVVLATNNCIGGGCTNIQFTAFKINQNGRSVSWFLNGDTIKDYTANTYFSNGNKINRADLFYVHADGRQKKEINLFGVNYLTGDYAWNTLALSGLWQLNKMRLKDTDGAQLWIDRTAIGSGFDITLA